MMNRRPLLIVGIVAIAVMLALNAWAWMALPAGSQIATHFGPSGQPDDYSSKAFGLLVIPATSIGLLALLYAVPSIEPRRANLSRTPGAYNAIAISTMLLMLVVDAIIVAYALGHEVDVGLVVSTGIGLLFIVVGLVLPRLHSSYLVGVRTPWTLTSDLAWKRTHVLSGWLFIAFGLVLIVATIVLPAAAMTPILLGGIVIILVVPTTYSCLVWRNDPDRRSQ